MEAVDTISYPLADDESSTEGVLRAVATVEETAPSALDPPLFDAVDPQALDAVVRSFDGDDAFVSFTYRGHDVTIGPDEVEVAEDSTLTSESA